MSYLRAPGHTQAGLAEAAAAPGPDIAHSKYRAMHAALSALSKAPGGISSDRLLVLLGDELRTQAGGGADTLALAKQLQDALVECNIITSDMSEHRFSSRGAKWYFEAKCIAPVP